ncbi:MAG: ribosome-associated translation inhibitor RaiA [Bacteroidales bacterium]|nr:ribosome-associated translation inhibitor RaiA [Candidatus Scybalousia scybalohippi]MCQ2326669.1 HPF/RaiA family ribosome-associated protein [Bacteroidales bacterium]
MNVKINAVKFRADEKLVSFVEEKVSKLDRHLPNALESEVTLKVDKPESENNKQAEIRLVIKGNDLFASKQADTFEEAVMLSIDALKPQIEKIKDKK